MCQFVESIKIINQKPCLLHLHQQRMNETLRAFGGEKTFCLEKHIQIPPNLGTQTFKCRVIYSPKSVEKAEFLPVGNYHFQNAQIVVDNQIQYKFKSLKRENLDHLYAKRGNADEIIIVKKSLVTDAYYFNLVFFSQKTGWITPKSPLLKGIKRALLLEKGIIKEGDIFVHDIKNYDTIRFINAIIDFEDAVEISTKNVFF